MKPSPRQIEEANKKYEALVEHLITEGYAEDRDAADNIIKGMSEAWFNLIID
jgi:hypothetical protein